MSRRDYRPEQVDWFFYLWEKEFEESSEKPMSPVAAWVVVLIVSVLAWALFLGVLAKVAGVF